MSSALSPFAQLTFSSRSPGRTETLIGASGGASAYLTFTWSVAMTPPVEYCTQRMFVNGFDDRRASRSGLEHPETPASALLNAIALAVVVENPVCAVGLNGPSMNSSGEGLAVLQVVALRTPITITLSVVASGGCPRSQLARSCNVEQLFAPMRMSAWTPFTVSDTADAAAGSSASASPEARRMSRRVIARKRPAAAAR